MDEIFVNISGFPKYQVSNYGNVKSFKRYKEGRILKPSINSRGYYHVVLSNEDGESTLNIHRLVAKHFIPNPDNLPFVDHIDGNKLNNNVSNLRWCNPQQNQFNSKKQDGTSSKYKGVCWDKRKNKYIACIGINGKLKHIGYFDNEEEAANAYNIKANELFGQFANLNIMD